MLASVVIPVWNSARYLEEALESVLSQAGVPLELIVVDDGSTDDSAALVRRVAPRARYRYQDHAGISAALNAGVALARGTHIGFLDADDVWAPRSLERRLRLFGVDAGLDAAAGHVEQFHSPDLDEALARTIRCPTVPTPGFLMGSLLVRRSIFLTTAFDPQFDAAQGVDWFVRAMDAGLRVRMLPDVVLRRRLHAANHSHLGIQRALYPRILKASLDRRRGGVGPASAIPIPGSVALPMKHRS
ncbi:MAG: glycosyltransferase [Betaproteobacteria bacterium]